MVARLHHKIAGALLVVPLLLFVTNKDDVVSAFIASTSNRRAPAPALIVVRDPSTVPAIDWDIFEMEEQRAFDSASIIQRQATTPQQFDHRDSYDSEQKVGTTTPGKIEIPPDDADAWKGSLLMAAGLLATQHDIPAMMLLLSTAASGEFGTAVRLTSRCAWHSFDVCKVLSMEGFQSVSDLLKDVGVIEKDQSKEEENWMMSWAKRTWNDAVKQERKWADSIRSSFTPDEPTEELTTLNLKTSSMMMAPVIIGPEETKTEQVQTFAATLQRENGVLLGLPVKPTDPLASSNKQRVRDLMRQQREMQQHNAAASDVQAQVTKGAVLIDESKVDSATQVLDTVTTDSRQRVRDLMRQRREGGSPSTTTDRKATAATPSLFAADGMTTTAALRQKGANASAADSRQRVRDLMRQRRQEEYTPATIVSSTTAIKLPTTTSTPNLFTSGGTTTTAANFESATRRAAYSRQRVRDLMRQRQELDGRNERLTTVTMAPVKEYVAHAACPVPKEAASITLMEDQFSKQRVVNAAIRNKIRGLMKERVVDKRTLEQNDPMNLEKEEKRKEEFPFSASGRPPLTMTEKKSLNQARAALAARQLQKRLLVATVTRVEPEQSQPRSWRRRVAQWLIGASPQGWVAAK